MGDSPVPAVAVKSLPKAVYDVDRDGNPDSIEWKWIQANKFWEPLRRRPLITHTQMGPDNYELKTAKTIKACGTEYSVGQKRLDPPTYKHPITRVITDFATRASAKEKKDPKHPEGAFTYSFALYAHMKPESKSEGHKKSWQLLCGPFFDPTFFWDDPDKEPTQAVAGQ